MAAQTPKSKTKRKASRKEKFLAALAVFGTVTKAAKISGWNRESAYVARREDPDFKDAWDNALEMAWDALEEEARRRAVHGVLEPIYYQGQLVDKVRKYSDQLLSKLLEGRRPGTFRPAQKVEVAGPDGGPVPVVLNIPPRAEGKPDV